MVEQDLEINYWEMESCSSHFECEISITRLWVGQQQRQDRQCFSSYKFFVMWWNNEKKQIIKHEESGTKREHTFDKHITQESLTRNHAVLVYFSFSIN